MSILNCVHKTRETYSENYTFNKLILQILSIVVSLFAKSSMLHYYFKSVYVYFLVNTNKTISNGWKYSTLSTGTHDEYMN